MQGIYRGSFSCFTHTELRCVVCDPWLSAGARLAGLSMRPALMVPGSIPGGVTSAALWQSSTLQGSLQACLMCGAGGQLTGPLARMWRTSAAAAWRPAGLITAAARAQAAATAEAMTHRDAHENCSVLFGLLISSSRTAVGCDLIDAGSR